jgi:hypothetical protein
VPGTDSSVGPAGSGGWYWKRLTGPNGNDIIDNALSSKPQVVQIDPSDTAFQTDSWAAVAQDRPVSVDRSCG